ncbi:MAG: response regulator [Pseudomonadota bacterium]
MSERGVTSILIVEDDPVDVKAFSRAAKKADLTLPIEVAPTGDDALQQLQKHRGATVPPVVVITDINMPGLNGHELMEDVRKDGALHKTLFFVLSSSDQTKDIERAYRNGALGYIVKGPSSAAIGSCAHLVKAYCASVSLP